VPIGVQRGARSAMLNVADAQEDQAYLDAYQKVVQTLTLMHKQGIFIVAGTDLGGAFHLHRELELFTEFGMTPAEVLKRKLADFFLVPGNPIEDLKAIKTISLVAKDGNIYFPSEVYPEFGIKPFTEIPKVKNSD